jgi:sarcosine oxidase
VNAAQANGARVFADTRVTSVSPHADGVVIGTHGFQIEARKVIVSAGAWLPKFTGIPLAPRRTPLFWFKPRDESKMFSGGVFDINKFPAFIRERPDGSTLWGHGAKMRDGDSFAIKIGLLDDGKSFDDADPDNFDRYISPARDYAVLSEEISAVFPDIDPVPHKVIPCIVTNSVDGQFVLGASPESERVIVGGGDSGHGHKHAPAIGEILAQLALDEEPFTDIGFMSTTRKYDVSGTWQKNNRLAAEFG